MSTLSAPFKVRLASGTKTTVVSSTGSVVIPATVSGGESVIFADNSLSTNVGVATVGTGTGGFTSYTASGASKIFDAVAVSGGVNYIRLSQGIAESGLTPGKATVLAAGPSSSIDIYEDPKGAGLWRLADVNLGTVSAGDVTLHTQLAKITWPSGSAIAANGSVSFTWTNNRVVSGAVYYPQISVERTAANPVGVVANISAVSTGGSLVIALYNTGSVATSGNIVLNALLF